MSFENKENKDNRDNAKNRPLSRTKTTANANLVNKEIALNKKKKVATSEELKRELEEAENFLQKANKDFQNFKAKETRKNNIDFNSDNDSALKFIEKTLEENGVLRKRNNPKMPLKEFLKENSNQNKNTFETNLDNNCNNTLQNKDCFNSPESKNNLEISKFNNNFNLSDLSRDNSNNQTPKDKKQNNIPCNDFTNKDIEFIAENNLLNKYRKQLRANGFPELGNILFSNENDQELLFKFFDYILIKKSNENGEKLKLKKTVFYIIFKYFQCIYKLFCFSFSAKISKKN